MQQIILFVQARNLLRIYVKPQPWKVRQRNFIHSGYTFILLLVNFFSFTMYILHNNEKKFKCRWFYFLISKFLLPKWGHNESQASGHVFIYFLAYMTNHFSTEKPSNKNWKEKMTPKFAITIIAFCPYCL